MTEINNVDREELARQIKEGFTSGRLDSQDDNGKTKYIAWDLKTNIWSDDEKIEKQPQEDIATKIKNELTIYLKKQEADLANIDRSTMEDFTNENDDWLGFTIIERNTDTDSWMEAILGKKINGRYFGIIFDYEVNINYEDNKVEDIINTLIGLYKNCQTVLKTLEKYS